MDAEVARAVRETETQKTTTVTLTHVRRGLTSGFEFLLVSLGMYIAPEKNSKPAWLSWGQRSWHAYRERHCSLLCGGESRDHLYDARTINW